MSQLFNISVWQHQPCGQVFVEIQSYITVVQQHMYRLDIARLEFKWIIYECLQHDWLTIKASPNELNLSHFYPFRSLHAYYFAEVSWSAESLELFFSKNFVTESAHSIEPIQSLSCNVREWVCVCHWMTFSLKVFFRWPVSLGMVELNLVIWLLGNLVNW